MLDIKFIRENKDLIAEASRKKHLKFDVGQLITADDKRRVLLQETEGLKAEQNKASAEIQNTPDKAAILARMKEVKAEFNKKEEALRELMGEWQKLMLAVPNVPDISVPEGASDADNKEIRTWGEPKKFDFAPKSHIELMEKNDLVDLERGTKLSGFRGYILKNEGALLEMAVLQFTLDSFAKSGFTPMVAPSLINRELLLGTGYLPQGEEDLYKTQDGAYLAGTSEVAVMGYHMDEILDKKDLPKKFVAFSPCFRREAGSHGKDTKGLIRVHEFYKVEQVVLCEASHETSVKLHEELTANSEMILQALGIPYHVVVNCGGDLGLGQVKKYDIEAWVPSEKKYRETHSASYFHDFQTRRLNIRYKDADGKMKFVHSLNNTAIASPRILVPLIENYQQSDGSIVIPEVLRPYMGGRKEIRR